MAAWTKTTLAARNRNEHLVPGVSARDAGEAEVQIAAAEELAGHLAEDRALRAVALRVTPIIGTLEIG